MDSTQSETLTGTVDVRFREYLFPPADPLPLMREWITSAERLNVREPRALALATVGPQGRASNRLVAITEITDAGLVFTTHADSQKGRELAENPWACGVLYWRETGQQLMVGGRVEQLSAGIAEELWERRPPYTHAMSSVSRQSEELLDIMALRAEAERLSHLGQRLPRPEGYAAYELQPSTLEFWATGQGRLHERLRYDRVNGHWVNRRLQP